MAQVIVRNLEDEVKSALKDRAARHGWSMEEEVRHILRNAVAANDATEPLSRLIAKRFAGLNFDGEIKELRGQAPRPVDFSQ
jgi:antitoxin FitA